MGIRDSRSVSAVLHIRCEPGTDERRYRLLLDLLRDITAVVRALPPYAALADVAGALRYWNASPRGLAQRVRQTALVRYDLDTHIGIAPTWSLAAMASARPGADGITEIENSTEAVTAWLAPLPIEALYGIGPAQAGELASYGLRTIGALAAAPLGTVQRILGGRAGRLLYERARGVDPRPVTPGEPEHTVIERRRFEYDTLDPAAIRTELLDAVVAVAARLRQRRQVARNLALTVTFADHTDLSRARTLPEPSAHTEDLRQAVYRMFDALGLQRARVRALTVRAEHLAPAATAPRQLSLDEVLENHLRIEPTIDRANRRFGPGALGPARLAHRGLAS